MGKLLNAETANQSNVKLLERNMEGVQLELKANRETISRLSSEKEQLEGRHTQHAAEINTLRKVPVYFIIYAQLMIVCSINSP